MIFAVSVCGRILKPINIRCLDNATFWSNRIFMRRYGFSVVPVIIG